MKGGEFPETATIQLVKSCAPGHSPDPVGFKIKKSKPFLVTAIGTGKQGAACPENKKEADLLIGPENIECNEIDHHELQELPEYKDPAIGGMHVGIE